MQYLFGIILLLMIIGAFSVWYEAQGKIHGIRQKLHDRVLSGKPARRNDLLILLERLYIAGYIFNQPSSGTNHEPPELINDPELAQLLSNLFADAALEQQLPRIGFSIRSTRHCPDNNFARQYSHLLVTPRNYAIGYNRKY
ncbi:hypothetical protein A167_00038 [Alcanivorax sp. S71-1-4]|uniref:hypothetical protein n=1 Tax=Alcanivorax sp. S71-1-4 TaxID=1177159 RepID=UPI00135ABAE8|nr:hypothetical protein [Alcanivorax sp. S71-1-4]KAF0811006.1 hypothetical protein A167_00038 [Alcanivorax sp. S71-1-4]